MLFILLLSLAPSIDSHNVIVMEILKIINKYTRLNMLIIYLTVKTMKNVRFTCNVLKSAIDDKKNNNILLDLLVNCRFFYIV